MWKAKEEIKEHMMKAFEQSGLPSNSEYYASAAEFIRTGYGIKEAGVSDYLTKVAFSLKWPAHAVEFLKCLNSLTEELSYEMDPKELSAEKRDELIAEYGLNAFEAVSQIHENDGDIDSTHVQIIHPEGDPESIWLVSDDSARINPLNTLLAKVIAAFPDDNLRAEYEWANYCSKPELNSYGGGATRVDKNGIHYIYTGDAIAGFDTQMQLCSQAQQILRSEDLGPDEYKSMAKSLLSYFHEAQELDVAGKLYNDSDELRIQYYDDDDGKHYCVEHESGDIKMMFRFSDYGSAEEAYGEAEKYVDTLIATAIVITPSEERYEFPWKDEYDLLWRQSVQVKRDSTGRYTVARASGVNLNSQDDMDM